MNPHIPPRSLTLEPGTVAIKPEVTASREGVLDGAWWPRTRDVRGELPALLSTLTAHFGRITRVGLDAEAWEGVQKPLFVDGHLVHIDWSPLGDDTVIVTRGDYDHFCLLAVPPEATYEEAQAALGMAVRTDNEATGTQILATSGIPHHG
ncbi:DUF5994 family protein [Streptomyces iconiensis]|uniref:DUF5994 family protein n=1 Tax=Streptomyces iconiensis TaxID=1384038 RepID=A0ABT6ZR41_9ACTN|nr:DUF5994 family protein [Streptomyces iconiensis]MDJ1131526.1 DUF5994 family protein [Streptomyces iconiensis]